MAHLCTLEHVRILHLVHVWAPVHLAALGGHYLAEVPQTRFLKNKLIISFTVFRLDIGERVVVSSLWSCPTPMSGKDIPLVIVMSWCFPRRVFPSLGP